MFRHLTLIALLAFSPLPAQAEVLSLTYTSRNAEASALIRLGLTLHALRNGDGRALLRQEGIGNGASLYQQGIGNLALIDQRGRDHSADLAQIGGGNAQILFQSGRGASARLRQTGDAVAITLQHGW